MTIHQLKERCWELRPPTHDQHPHYGSEAEALTDLKQDRENDEQPYPDTKPVQLAAPCWLVQCDGECEVVLDTEDEGYIVHSESRQDAEELMADYEWAYVRDLVFCPEDAPADGQVPPPSPAQLEAAGQLRLPGVA